MFDQWKVWSGYFKMVIPAVVKDIKGNALQSILLFYTHKHTHTHPRIHNKYIYNLRERRSRNIAIFEFFRFYYFY